MIRDLWQPKLEIWHCKIVILAGFSPLVCWHFCSVPGADSGPESSAGAGAGADADTDTDAGAGADADAGVGADAGIWVGDLCSIL